MLLHSVTFSMDELRVVLDRWAKTGPSVELPTRFIYRGSQRTWFCEIGPISPPLAELLNDLRFR